MSAMEYDNEGGAPYSAEPRGSYGRNDRSRSPRGDRHDESARIRSASPGGRDSRGPPASNGAEEEAANTGSNLFVTGIHPRLSEEEITRLFETYGTVEKCNIMRDPHTRESRGFGFVNMLTTDQADAAKEGLQGQVHEGRTLSIEKARRSRPRTPTPGRYFGPPKRDFRGRGSGIGRFSDRDRYNDRYDDRRYSRRDDYSRGGRDDRYGGRRDRDDYYGPRNVDRYASREDRYSYRGGDDRRGGYYDRQGFNDSSAREGGREGGREGYSGSRSYEDRDYRY